MIAGHELLRCPSVAGPAGKRRPGLLFEKTRYNSTPLITWERASSYLQPRWQRASVKALQGAVQGPLLGLFIFPCEAAQATNNEGKSK